MKRLSSILVLGLATLALACEGGKNNDDDGGTSSRLQPFRDTWRQEAEIPFRYLDDNGNPQITLVRIGGRKYQDNFANRGDIVVEFEEGRNSIKIEMRRFTMALSRDAADDDFAALSLWSYNQQQTSPRKPGDMDQERRCDTASAWMDDCAIRVYYDGQSQIARAGADLRVTLPASYKHAIRVVTEDADGDDDYINRGTVCVRNLPGSAEVELANGIASVILADDIQPIPICTPAQLEACETWQHEDEDAPWHPDCDCIQQTQSSWGSVKVESRDGAAADITIDTPAHLWMNITARNEGPHQVAGESHCRATVDLPDFDGVYDFPWQATGNTPPPSSFASGGYGTIAISKDCSPVVYTASPEEFVGHGMGNMQDVDPLRGDIVICSNCIRAQSCDQLIDG
jgi:hypothetical protein